MRKKKIDFKKYADMHEEKELIGFGDTKITVRNHIPYDDKVQMAKEVIENCVMIHDDSCCYESVDIYAEKIKAIMKYYTNIQVDEASAHEVADFVITPMGEAPSMDLEPLSDLIEALFEARPSCAAEVGMLMKGTLRSIEAILAISILLPPPTARMNVDLCSRILLLTSSMFSTVA